MAYIRRLHPMKDWDGTSEKPRFLTSSVGRWGADFHEVEYGPYGSWDVDVSLLHISTLLTPTRHRAGGSRSPFQLMAPSGAVVVPGQRLLGGWMGAMRGRHLFLTTEEVERILNAKLGGAGFQPRHFLQQGEANHRDTVVEHLMEVLSLDAAAGSPSGPLFAQFVISALLHHLLGTDDETLPLRRLGGRDRQVQQVVDQIQAELAGRPSLTALAASIDVSVQYLCRVFKQATGLTPHQYLLRERVKRARRLIEAGQLTLAEVADEVGFADQSQMTTTFKKVLGVTPSVFRRKQ